MALTFLVLSEDSWQLIVVATRTAFIMLMTLSASMPLDSARIPLPLPRTLAASGPAKVVSLPINGVLVHRYLGFSRLKWDDIVLDSNRSGSDRKPWFKTRPKYSDEPSYRIRQNLQIRSERLRSMLTQLEHLLT